MISERQIESWLIRNSYRAKNWIVLIEFDNIMRSDVKSFLDIDSGKITEFDIPESIGPDNITDKRNLQYVYSVYIDKDRMTTIVRDVDYYYLIKNSKTMKELGYDDVMLFETVYGKNRVDSSGDQTVITNDNSDNVNLMAILNEFIGKSDRNLYSNEELKKIATSIKVCEKLIRQSNRHKLISMITSRLRELCEDLSSKERGDDDKIIINSTITRARYLKNLISKLSSKDRKDLSIKRVDKMSSSYEIDGVIPSDFCCKSVEEKIELWKRYVTGQGRYESEKLDLSGFYHLTPDVLSKTPRNREITEIKFSQNINIKDFGWLVNFSGLKCINFWSCTQLTNNMIDKLFEYIESNGNIQLTSLGINHCYQITGHAILSLKYLKHIYQVWFNNPAMITQYSIWDSTVSDEEWDGLPKIPSLHKLMIDSDGLTPDFLSSLIEKCPNLMHLVVSDKNINRIRQYSIGSRGGREDDETLLIQSKDNPKKSFKLFKPVRFIKLSEQYSSATFSDTMLDVIKDRSPCSVDQMETDPTDSLTGQV